MEDKNTCKTCRFWVLKNQVFIGEGDMSKSCDYIGTGECHRMPPSMMGNYTKYPSTTEKDWCGEHKVKEEN